MSVQATILHNEFEKYDLEITFTSYRSQRANSNYLVFPNCVRDY